MSKSESHSIGKENVRIHTLEGMYQDYFLDYASYVILERAVPDVEDGLKPVQRRILYSMKELDDGRYHKVANIIGHTMQYHPHGDAAIGDALVKLGQYQLMIDTQGNWGDVRTGDSAAAPRYIEARLTKFALEVAFNKDTTKWQLSYDGRKNEPIALPVKFPLLLAQGVEGIAVGLSTKILPHNLGELIKASIKVLENKRVTLLPDFETGGLIDIANYQNGKRGGKLLVRSVIEKKEKNVLIIKELPFGVTTSSIIDSIIKANDKGKIKIKKVLDNTAHEVEIVIELMPGVSPDLTIDALYAFTNCEVPISPNACIIMDGKPAFLSVDEILKISTDHTRELLRWELELKKEELEANWHFASLERIFIENRVYHEIEECESWEAALETIDEEMRKYICTPDQDCEEGGKIKLSRPFTEEDILRLTEIRIKKISKYNTYEAVEKIRALEEELDLVEHDLKHLTDYTIHYFERLYLKYGVHHPRRSRISSFENIDIVQVAANNVRLFANMNEGFAGWGLKRDAFIRDCSDLDDIIAFREDAVFQVSRIGEKVFLGKKLIYVDVWKKGDDRTTYNLIYQDAKTGKAMAKRFNVKAITRDREYDLSKGNKGSRVLYFTANPNGEAEVVQVQLTSGSRAKKKIFEYDFGKLDIKGRQSQGNIVTKYPVRKITHLEVGDSTLGAQEIWMDEVSGRLNNDGRGIHLGAFDTGDLILSFCQEGNYLLSEPNKSLKLDTADLIYISKYHEDDVISAIYYDGHRDRTMIKRFQIETATIGSKFTFITDHNRSKLLFVTTERNVLVKYQLKIGKKKVSRILDLDRFIDLKGWKAIGNKLCEKMISDIKPVSQGSGEQAHSSQPENYSAGDTIEFDLDENGHGK